MAKFELRNKRILITGASSGIGRQLAFELAKYMARLVLVSRNLKLLKEVAEEIQFRHPGVNQPLQIACDVSDEAGVKRTVNRAVELLGGIDILINNAGIGVYGPCQETSAEDFRKVLSVNFLGALNFTIHLLPFMQHGQGGKIVFISSVASIYGIPFYSAYCASKAALRSLSQTLRAECADEGISVLHVSPDYTDTAFFSKEKITGGVRTHHEKRSGVDAVAKRIVRDIVHNKKETVLSFRARSLLITSCLLPWFTQAYFRRRAMKLILNEK